MTRMPGTITAELMEHADGRPVAYIDATAITVFVYQDSEGTHVIDICTRDDSGNQTHVLLDGLALPQHRPAGAQSAVDLAAG